MLQEITTNLKNRCEMSLVKSCLIYKEMMIIEKSFKYINLGNQLHYKRNNQKLHHVECYDEKR